MLFKKSTEAESIEDAAVVVRKQRRIHSFLPFTARKPKKQLDQSSKYKGRGEMFGMDIFFAVRIIMFTLIGLLLGIITVMVSPSMWPLGMVLFIVCAGYGFRLMHIARTGGYFVIEMTCVGVYFPKAHEMAGQYFNPASNSAFKRNQKVTFQTEEGKKVVFNFDRGRKFLEGAAYAFYFRTPPDGREVTIDILEGLKIDHSVVPQSISAN